MLCLSIKCVEEICKSSKIIQAFSALKVTKLLPDLFVLKTGLNFHMLLRFKVTVSQARRRLRTFFCSLYMRPSILALATRSISINHNWIK